MSSPIGDALRVAHQLDARDKRTLARIGELVLGVTHQDVSEEESSPTPVQEEPGAQTTESAGASGRFGRWLRSSGDRVSRWLRTNRFSRWLRTNRFSRWLVARSRWVWGLILVAGAVASAAFIGLSPIAGAGIAGIAVAVAGVIWFLGQPGPTPIPSQLIGRGGGADRDLENPRTDPSAVLDPPTPGEDPPLEPLFLPRWTPGILATALAIETGHGPLDIDRIVDSLARLELRTPLPHRRRWTLDRGVLALVDVSEGMLPFDSDVADILARVRRVVGPDVTLRQFDGYPLTVGGGPDRIAGMDEMPQTPRTALAITNFGLYGPAVRARSAAIEGEWLELADTLAHAGCPVVALVPDRGSRVPPALRSRIAVIEWDRGTSVAAAARAVGR